MNSLQLFTTTHEHWSSLSRGKRGLWALQPLWLKGAQAKCLYFGDEVGGPIGPDFKSEDSCSSCRHVAASGLVKLKSRSYME